MRFLPSVTLLIILIQMQIVFSAQPTDVFQQCEFRKIKIEELNDFLIEQTETVFNQRTISTQVEELVEYFEQLTEKNWEKLKKNCSKESFNLFMLSVAKNSIQNNPRYLVKILTTKGFPLGESYQFKLAPVHQKILKLFTNKYIHQHSCSIPNKATIADTQVISIIQEITSHPNYPRHQMEDIYDCIEEVEKRIGRYLDFKNNPTCNGLSYFYNGNLSDTQKGNWVEKDLFCEGYRSYQLLSLISKKPNLLLGNEIINAINTLGPFTEGHPKFSCKFYYYHPKRESCYPQD